MDAQEAEKTHEESWSKPCRTRGKISFARGDLNFGRCALAQGWPRPFSYRRVDIGYRWLLQAILLGVQGFRKTVCRLPKLVVFSSSNLRPDGWHQWLQHQFSNCFCFVPAQIGDARQNAACKCADKRLFLCTYMVFLWQEFRKCWEPCSIFSALSDEGSSAEVGQCRSNAIHGRRSWATGFARMDTHHVVF